LKGKHENVQKIIDVEIRRFKELSLRNKKIIGKMIDKNNISSSDMIKLYESHGITPNEIQEAAKEKNVDIHVSSNFYAELSENKSVKEFKKIDTRFEKYVSKPLYFEDWRKMEFESYIIGIVDNDIVLDGSYFYPTSGGQMHDMGTIEWS
jgi:alanyl-tRNA synthetase